MDIADIAQRNIDFLVTIATHPDVHDEAPATGYCLYCGEPLERGRRWCNAECRDAWELEQHRNTGGANGK